jgi:metal-responsive CopG/Arc/MetJ family transcriptional regulator
MPDAALWDEFGAATEGRHKDGRSGVIRDFMRWYLRKPDAALPEQPEQPEG